MIKKILVAALSLVTLCNVVTAQDAETKTAKKTKEKNKTKKVIIKKDKEDISDDDEKRIEIITDESEAPTPPTPPIPPIPPTPPVKPGKNKMVIMVDGDKISIDGKDVASMNDKELQLLDEETGKLKIIAPYLGNKNIDFKRSLEDMENNFSYQWNDDTPMNKALLGVVTEKNEKGVKIISVSKESGAEKAGLKKDDIITKINSDEIKTSADLVKAIGRYKPEEKVTVTYLHDGKEQNAEATLGSNKSAQKRVYMWDRNYNNRNDMYAPEMWGQGNGYNDFLVSHSKPKLGAKVQDMEEGDGVKILDVDKESPAEKSGLQKDDVIIEIEKGVVKGVDDLRKKLKDAKAGEVYKITYKRNGKLENTTIKFPKKLKTADL